MNVGCGDKRRLHVVYNEYTRANVYAALVAVFRSACNANYEYARIKAEIFVVGAKRRAM